MNPAPTVTDTAPTTKPGTMPGRSAIAKAMYPASAGTRNPKAAWPRTVHTAPR
jgi:hypothetical protein